MVPCQMCEEEVANSLTEILNRVMVNLEKENQQVRQDEEPEESDVEVNSPDKPEDEIPPKCDEELEDSHEIGKENGDEENFNIEEIEVAFVVDELIRKVLEESDSEDKEETFSIQEETSSTKDETSSVKDTSSAEEETSSAKADISSVKEDTSSANENTSSVTEDTSTKKDASTNKEGDSSTKKEASTNKEGDSPTKKDASTNKKGDSLTKKDASTNKKGVSSTKRDASTTSSNIKSPSTVVVILSTNGDNEAKDVPTVLPNGQPLVDAVPVEPPCPHLKGILKPRRCRCGSSHHVDFEMVPQLIRSYDESKDFTADIQFVEQHPKKVVSYRKLFAAQRTADDASQESQNR